MDEDTNLISLLAQHCRSSDCVNHEASNSHDDDSMEDFCFANDLNFSDSLSMDAESEGSHKHFEDSIASVNLASLIKMCSGDMEVVAAVMESFCCQVRQSGYM